MTKVLRVTAADPPPPGITPDLLGDWPYLGTGESGEDVYGVFRGANVPVPILASKVRGMDPGHWVIGSGYCNGPPYAAWPPASGFDGGESDADEPPSGDYAHFATGEVIHAELIDIGGSSEVGWFPWCCVGCSGGTLNDPTTVCYVSAGPVPDFWVLLNITTPGETTLTGDYRCFDYHYTDDPVLSPANPTNCYQVSAEFQKLIEGITRRFYVRVQLHLWDETPSITVDLFILRTPYGGAAYWSTLDTWRKSYATPAACREWGIPGEHIPHVSPVSETERRCYLMAATFLDWMP